MSNSSASSSGDSIEDVFIELHDPPADVQSLVDDIKKHAQSLGPIVLTKYEELRALAVPNLDVLHERWSQSKATRRTNVLKAAYPDIPQDHRPETFRSGALSKIVMHADHARLPFIDITDLGDKVSLPIFIHARSQHPPHTFALTEQIFVPRELRLGSGDPQKRSGTWAPLLKMQLNEADHYGDLVSFATEDEASDFEFDGNGLGIGAGLQALYTQDIMLGFLLKCTKAILCDRLKGLDVNAIITTTTAPIWLYPTESVCEFSQIVARTPYRARSGLDLDRLRKLISDESRTAQDRVWQLREDPNYFEDAYRELAAHDKANVPDKWGKPHPVIKDQKSAFPGAILHNLVARSHYLLVLWDQLDIQLQRIQALFNDHPDGVDVKTLTPKDLVEAIQYLHSILMQMTSIVLDELSQFAAVPYL
jgi:hypothetical protein